MTNDKDLSQIKDWLQQSYEELKKPPDKQYMPTFWGKLWRSLGLCSKGFFHNWKVDNNKYVRRCEKCRIVEIHYSSDMPFEFRGWEEIGRN